MTQRPLENLRIVEFAGLGPGPFAGQMLADLGADVIVIDRPKRGPVSLSHAVERRGKRSIILDLKSEAGRAVALDLVAWAHGLIEGFRPGVMERLGLGPERCHGVNPALVYGRMTGWGQTGPYAGMAGHDLNYIGLTGALAAMGPANAPPPPPLNLLGDFGGGSMMLVAGLLAGRLKAVETGAGSVVDAAITDGVSALMGMIHSWHAAGRWTPERGDNALDGGAPYYRCYQTACGGFVSVAALEPQFHAALLAALDIDPSTHGAQHDKTRHAEQVERFAAVFAGRSRDAWMAVFEGTDACVAPVLDYREMAAHKQNRARFATEDRDGLRHPRPAPVFGAAAAVPPPEIPEDGAHSAEILAMLGRDDADIAALLATGAAHGPASGAG
ncbi:MAG: CaiB/BaiF CoA-transferase family protein [Pseudomonadota bacterium]